MNVLKPIKEEKGAGLLELVVAMPLISAMLATFAVLLCFGIRSYVFTRSDFELQEQVRIPLERIVRDLNNAEEAKVVDNKLAIQCRNSTELLWASYYLANSDKVYPKIMRSWKNNPQPLTGETKLADIQIKKFYSEVKDRTVYIEIAANNLLTKTEFALHTAVTLPEKDIE